MFSFNFHDSLNRDDDSLVINQDEYVLEPLLQNSLPRWIISPSFEGH